MWAPLAAAHGHAGGLRLSTANPAAVFDLQVNLFYPEIFAPDPVVRYNGQWWPAMSVSCAVANTPFKLISITRSQRSSA